MLHSGQLGSKYNIFGVLVHRIDGHQAKTCTCADIRLIGKREYMESSRTQEKESKRNTLCINGWCYFLQANGDQSRSLPHQNRRAPSRHHGGVGGWVSARFPLTQTSHNEDRHQKDHTPDSGTKCGRGGQARSFRP